MTEEEAKTKWCPFARVASVMLQPGGTPIGAAGANRAALSREIDAHAGGDRMNPDSARCIASDCMAWRWRMVANPDWSPDASGMWPQPNPYSQAPSGIPSKTEGYCGLSGGSQ